MAALDLGWMIGIGAVLLGACAILWGLTNGKIKLQLSPPRSIEERRALYPASAGAVIIKARPRRALLTLLPAAALAVALACLMPYVKREDLPLLCGHLTAAEAARWIRLLVFPVLPATLSLIALFTAARAVRVLRGGYAPPLDAVVMQDTIAVTGWRARLQGLVGLLVMPVLVGVIACLAYATRQAFDEPGLQASVAAQCAARAPAGSQNKP